MKKLATITLVVVLASCYGFCAYADPNPSKEYRFVGYSSAKTTGCPFNKFPGGILAMSALCQPDFGRSARMCTTKEYITSPYPGSVAGGGPGWIQPYIVGFLYDDSDPVIKKYVCIDFSSYSAPDCWYNMNCHQWAGSGKGLTSGYGYPAQIYGWIVPARLRSPAVLHKWNDAAKRHQ